MQALKRNRLSKSCLLELLLFLFYCSGCQTDHAKQKDHEEKQKPEISEQIHKLLSGMTQKDGNLCTNVNDHIYEKLRFRLIVNKKKDPVQDSRVDLVLTKTIDKQEASIDTIVDSCYQLVGFFDPELIVPSHFFTQITLLSPEHSYSIYLDQSQKYAYGNLRINQKTIGIKFHLHPKVTGFIEKEIKNFQKHP